MHFKRNTYLHAYHIDWQDSQTANFLKLTKFKSIPFLIIKSSFPYPNNNPWKTWLNLKSHLGSNLCTLPCVSRLSFLLVIELRPWVTTDEINPSRSLTSTGGAEEEGSDSLKSSSCEGTNLSSLTITSSATGLKSFANSSSLSAGISPLVPWKNYYTN